MSVIKANTKYLYGKYFISQYSRKCYVFVAFR